MLSERCTMESLSAGDAVSKSVAGVAFRRLSMLLMVMSTLATGCGALGPPLVAIDDNASGEPACLDLWSLMHVSSGTVIAQELGSDSFLPTVALLTAWENVEPGLWPDWNESRLNRNCDVVVGTIGWMIQRLAAQKSYVAKRIPFDDEKQLLE